MSSQQYINRFQLEKPEDLEADWSKWDIRFWERNPRYVRMIDGRWFMVEEVKGDLVFGVPISWEIFRRTMESERNRYRRLRVEHHILMVLAGACGIAAAVGLIGIREGYVARGLPFWLAGIAFFLAFIREGIKKASQLRMITVVDPGPKIEGRPRETVEQQEPFGVGGGVIEGNMAFDFMRRRTSGEL